MRYILRVCLSLCQRSLCLSAVIVTFFCACGESQELESSSEESLEVTQLYQQHCSLCHGVNGEGGIGRALNTPHISDMSEAQLFMMIYEGIGTAMPSFKSTLSSEQIAELIAHIRSFSDADLELQELEE